MLLLDVNRSSILPALGLVARWPVEAALDLVVDKAVRVHALDHLTAEGRGPSAVRLGGGTVRG